MDFRHSPEYQGLASWCRRLNNLLTSDLAVEAPQYLMENPDLVFEPSLQILDQWHADARERDDPASLQRIMLFRNLLSFVWPLLVCTPLEIAAASAAHPELMARFLELDVRSIDGLEQLVQTGPDLRAELVRLALHEISEIEWSVLVLLSIEAAGDSSLEWIQEKQVLIEYEAELFLNTLAAWAEGSRGEGLKAILVRARERMRTLRREVRSGNLQLHNMPLLRLVIRFVGSDSWDECLELLRVHPELLTDEGLEEMRSQVQSALVYAAREGNPVPLTRSVMHLDLLEKARRLGIGPGFEALPAMPDALWVPAGLMEGVTPPIPSWQAFRETQRARPEQTEMLARLLRVALARPELRSGLGNGPETPGLERPASEGDIERLELMALLQFVLRCTATEAASLASRERPLLSSAAMLCALEDLPVPETALLQDLMVGITYLMGSASGNDLLSLLGSIAPTDLDRLAASGAALFLMLGALAHFAACESSEDRLAFAAQNPVVAHPNTLRLLRDILTRCSSDLRVRLASCESMVERASGMGSVAVALASIADGADVPDIVRAVVAWAGIQSMERMLALVRDQPALLSADATSAIESILAAIRGQGNAEQIFRAQVRHAWLLAARREVREGDADLTRPSLDLPGADSAEILIHTLEINLAAGIWTAISRVDLTDTFFAILDAWIEHLDACLGNEASELLEEARGQCLLWRDRFGQPSLEHRTELIGPLLGLIGEMDEGVRRRTLAEHPGLIHGQAAADILGDWLITARDTGQVEIASRIEECIRLLRVVGESDMEEVSATHGGERDGAADRDGEVSRARRLSSLAARVRSAIDDGPEAYVMLVMSEILFADPAADEVMRSAFAQMPPEFFDRHRKLVMLAADPLLRSLMDGTLTSDQQERLDQLDTRLFQFLIAPDWQFRYWLVARRPELRTATAVLRAYMLRPMIRDRVSEGVATEAEVLRADQALVEAILFLRRASEVAVQVAVWEKQAELAGAVPDVDHLGYARLLLHLPPDYGRKLNPSSEQFVETLCEAMALPELDDEDRAEIQAQIGLFVRTRYALHGHPTDLSQAIEHYRRSAELSLLDGTEKAVRLRNLASALIIRFESQGRERTDLTEALAHLRGAQTMAIVDAARGPVLGELGRVLLTLCQADGVYSDLDEAVGLIEEAIRITPSCTDDWVGWHINLITALDLNANHRGDPAALHRALQVFQEALPHVDTGTRLWFPLMFNVANARVSLGEMRRVAAEIDTAIEEFTQLDVVSLTKAQRAALSLGLGNAWRGRYLLDHSQDSLLRAAASYAEALDGVPDPSPNAARCLNNLARLLQEWEESAGGPDRERIVDIYERVLALPLTATWPHLSVVAARNYGHYLHGTRRYAQARSAYERGLVALELMRGSARAEEDRLYLAEEYAALHARLVHCCLETRDAAGALGYALSAKSRAFADRQAAGGIPVGISSPVLETLRSDAEDTHARLVRLRALVAGDEVPRTSATVNPPRARLAAYRAEIARFQHRESRIWQELLDRGDPDASRAPTPPVPALAEIQSALTDSHTMVLEFFVDAVGWGVFAVSSDQVRHVRMANGDPPWADWIRGLFTADNSPRPMDVFDEVMRGLYAFFLAGVEPYLPSPGTPLVIAPTGMLSLFPLGAALLSVGDRLLDRYIVSTVPSCHLFRDCAQKNYTSVLMISHPGRKGTRGHIPFAQVEASETSRLFPDAVRLAGPDLTLSALADQVGCYEVVHFACHGYFDWQQPASSGLILPNGNWVTLLDILTRLRFKSASLVVLSACDLGLEMPRPGDEHIGLVRALMVAGASTVVASLWTVNDLSTMLLIRRFYSELASLTAGGTRSVAEALRNAQRWLREASLDEIVEILKPIERHLWAEGESELTLKIIFRRQALEIVGQHHPFAHAFHWSGFQVYGRDL